jgi:transposase
MIELHNLRRLHAAQKVRIQKLEEQVRLLKKENALLREENTELKRGMQDMKLQVEELRTMVFGRKRKKDDHDDVPPVQRPSAPPRAPESYRRPMPKKDEVTDTTNHPVDACAHCKGAFAERETAAYFVEDIPLPQKRLVIKHEVERGYCPSCRRWSAGSPLPSATVVLGENVKRYAAYLSVVCRQSYAQIQDILMHTYEFAVSQGEIAKILEKEGNLLRPEYERLKERIRGEPSVHLDETGWRLFIGDGYRRFAWTMTGGTSAESVFTVGKTRGKGNATDLLGDSRAIVVSDDYGAYRRLEQPHQLCLAHILRKLRDLARSGEITGASHDHCVAAYATFAAIYADIEKARMSSDPDASHDALRKRLQTFALPDPLDPAKLSRVKRQVSERTENYLTCLLYPGVASDNNAAERSLRHLVLKRKISFGSLNEKTAETLAILLSVLMSFKQRGTLRDYLVGV